MPRRNRNRRMKVFHRGPATSSDHSRTFISASTPRRHHRRLPDAAPLPPSPTPCHHSSSAPPLARRACGDDDEVHGGAQKQPQQRCPRREKKAASASSRPPPTTTAAPPPVAASMVAIRCGGGVWGGVGCGGEARASRRASAFIVEAVSGGRARGPLGSLAVTGAGAIKTAGFFCLAVRSPPTRGPVGNWLRWRFPRVLASTMWAPFARG